MTTLPTDQKYPYLTWRQLKAKHPDSWVLLLNPKSPPTGYKVFGGEFIYSDKNQENVFEQAYQLPKGSRLRIIYTGELNLPDNVALCL